MTTTGIHIRHPAAAASSRVAIGEVEMGVLLGIEIFRASRKQAECITRGPS